MKTLSVFVTLCTATLLLLGLSACSPQAAPGEMATTGQEPPTSQPISPTQAQETGSNAILACDKIMPPDEADLLLNRLPATLSEQSAPGETSCTWQYTSKSGAAVQFQVWVGFGGSAVAAWENARKAEVSTQPADLAVIQIDGLGDENYAFTSNPGGQQVVYVRRGTQTLILHYQAADVLYLGNESGIIDICERVFTRLGS